MLHTYVFQFLMMQQRAEFGEELSSLVVSDKKEPKWNRRRDSR